MKLSILSWSPTPLAAALEKALVTLLNASVFHTTRGSNPRSVPHTQCFVGCDAIIELIPVGASNSNLLDAVYSLRAPRPSPILAPLMQIIPNGTSLTESFLRNPKYPWRVFPDTHAILKHPILLLDIIRFLIGGWNHKLDYDKFLSWVKSVSYQDCRTWMAKLCFCLMGLDDPTPEISKRNLIALRKLAEDIRNLTGLDYPHEFDFKIPALLRKIAQTANATDDVFIKTIQSNKFYIELKDSLPVYLADIMRYS